MIARIYTFRRFHENESVRNREKSERKAQFTVSLFILLSLFLKPVKLDGLKPPFSAFIGYSERKLQRKRRFLAAKPKKSVLLENQAMAGTNEHNTILELDMSNKQYNLLDKEMAEYFWLLSANFGSRKWLYFCLYFWSVSDNRYATKYSNSIRTGWLETLS